MFMLYKNNSPSFMKIAQSIINSIRTGKIPAFMNKIPNFKLKI